jgi:hypothetical protein
MTPIAFDVQVTTDDTTGVVQSVYFKIRGGRVLQTVEFEDGAAFADYNRYGELIGIELLGPCKVSVVDKLAANESKEARLKVKEYVKNSGPRALVAL